MSGYETFTSLVRRGGFSRRVMTRAQFTKLATATTFGMSLGILGSSCGPQSSSPAACVGWPRRGGS